MQGLTNNRVEVYVRFYREIKTDQDREVHNAESLLKSIVDEQIHPWSYELVKYSHILHPSEDVIKTTQLLRKLGEAGLDALRGLEAMGVQLTEEQRRGIRELAHVAESTVQNIITKKVEEVAALEQKLGQADLFVEEWGERFKRLNSEFSVKHENMKRIR